MASNQENFNEMTITHLQSVDGVIFDVELPIAMRSGVIKYMIDSLGPDNLDEPLPLKCVESDILKKVIEFAIHHKNDPMPNADNKHKTPLTEWDKKFLQVDINILIELIRAANYLDMNDLLYLATQAMAKKCFEGKKPEFIMEAAYLLSD